MAGPVAENISEHCCHHAERWKQRTADDWAGWKGIRGVEISEDRNTYTQTYPARRSSLQLSQMTRPAWRTGAATGAATRRQHRDGLIIRLFLVQLSREEPKWMLRSANRRSADWVATYV